MDNFEEKAKDWDNAARVEMASAIAAAMIKRVKLKKTYKVMDFGAGTGLISFKTAQLVNSVTAVDSSAAMLDNLRQKIEESKTGNVTILQADIETLDSFQEKYDVIFSSMTMHHIKDTAGAFKKLFNALKENGRIAIADLEKEDGTFHNDNNGIYHYGFDRDEIFDLMADAGFTGIRIKTVYNVDRNNRKYSIFLVCAEKISARKRNAYIFGGHAFTVLGIIGFITPIMPAAPFLIVAAALYLRGSNGFYKWLIHHKILGRFVRDFMEGRGISMQAKIMGIGSAWAGMAVTSYFLISDNWMKIAFAAGVLAATIFIIFIPTKKKNK
jgi:uncharacterized membrane protein YbaN (DUF454 family)/ubiquinone/menaquinone biosynthesis C-methylase UbiE